MPLRVVPTAGWESRVAVAELGYPALRRFERASRRSACTGRFPIRGRPDVRRQVVGQTPSAISREAHAIPSVVARRSARQKGKRRLTPKSRAPLQATVLTQKAMAKQDDGSEVIPHYLTDDDRKWLRQRIEEQGIKKPELARRVGVTRQTIYYLLSGEIGSSLDWAAIVSAVGGTPPSGHPPVTDPRLKELVRMWPSLSDDDRRLIETTAKRLATKKS